MLIKCPECGKEISDKASACPFCGCPKSEWETTAGTTDVQRAESISPTEIRESESVFPFTVVEKHENHVLVRCNQCGDIAIRGIQEVREEDGKTIFPFGLNCRKCGASVLGGSYVKTNSTEVMSKHEEQLTRRQPEPRPQEADRSARKCSKCGGNMSVQVVTEQKNAGCFTILLYIILAITVVGLLIVIPLALRKKTETVTYAVCQKCGRKIELSRT